MRAVEGGGRAEAAALDGAVCLFARLRGGGAVWMAGGWEEGGEGGRGEGGGASSCSMRSSLKEERTIGR